MAKIDKVFIDTSELFPFTIMDLLLTLAEQFVFTWVWTDELLDEWERVIVETRRCIARLNCSCSFLRSSRPSP